MAVPFQTDPARLRARLTDWLAVHDATPGDGPTRWELGEPCVPPGQGYSGELVLLPAHRTGPDGRRVARPLVVRLAPRRFQLYPWDRFAEQCRVVEILGRHSDVPVPPVYGVELDPAVLGAPFVVLGLVDGDVPPDIPPYHMQGFLHEATPAERARMWDAALVAMARIHRLDPGQLGLEFAGQPEYGPAGMAQQLAAYERHLDFFAPEDVARATLVAALDWLRAHPPAEPHPVRLLWGDARLGNMIFQGERVASVLDWEMMSLGQPETDLGWFLHLDRHLSEGVGIARLSGLPDRTETAARYAELLGRPLVDLDHHLLFASVRHTLLGARVTRMIREYELLPPHLVPRIDRYAATLLTRVLVETRDARA
ncbi:putative aminoglycoside phosphotransferase [Frankia canadensis]|uniref:Putative aminoglycoside phosphotransferase n=1 Tax=Frankia canadensis TaxID=1836972 RepID=A0A2I2KL11_9ACTN|nr:phosphotransferase family protein [Frankia canadensis]SNQ46358.1 putative aminoglycoside phosphotransferase [Frankia canadensis]SOU53648.1 putative aminoglycoside phosphotransferase [Frankia canadensis]